MKARITLKPVVEGGSQTLPPRTPYGAHFIHFTSPEYQGREVTLTYEEEPKHGVPLLCDVKPLPRGDFGGNYGAAKFDLYSGHCRIGEGYFLLEKVA